MEVKINGSIKLVCFLVCILIFLFLIISLCGEVKDIAFGFYRDIFDDIFDASVLELAKNEYNGEFSLNAVKNYIYDISLKPLGVLYTFTINNENGYAIITSINNAFSLNEIFFNSLDPYHNFEQGYRIYIKPLMYMFYDNESYYLSDGTKINEDQLGQIKEEAYAASDDTLQLNTNILHYTNKIENKKALATLYPNITEISELSNGCVPIAAGNIIQYWDRYYVDLIPNFTPGRNLGNTYIYNTLKPSESEFIRQLYIDMGTIPNTGTTITHFKDGLRTYCNRQGYSVNYNNCIKNDILSINDVIQCIQKNIPLIMFIDYFDLWEITPDNVEKYDIINHWYASFAHAMAVFGYNEITYKSTEGELTKDTYLIVSTGMQVRSKGYYKINNNNDISAIYGVEIGTI